MLRVGLSRGNTRDDGKCGSASGPATAHESGSLRSKIGGSIALGNDARHGHHRTTGGTTRRRRRRHRPPTAEHLHQSYNRSTRPLTTRHRHHSGRRPCAPVLRRPGALKWVAVIDKERLDLASMFTGGNPALFRVHRSEASTDAIVLNWLVSNCVNRVDKQKSLWVVGGSRRPGEERDVGAPSPTCLDLSVLLVFSVATHNKWGVP